MALSEDTDREKEEEERPWCEGAAGMCRALLWHGQGSGESLWVRPNREDSVWGACYQTQGLGEEWIKPSLNPLGKLEDGRVWCSWAP